MKHALLTLFLSLPFISITAQQVKQKRKQPDGFFNAGAGITGIEENRFGPSVTTNFGVRLGGPVFIGGGIDANFYSQSKPVVCFYPELRIMPLLDGPYQLMIMGGFGKAINAGNYLNVGLGVRRKKPSRLGQYIQAKYIRYKEGEVSDTEQRIDAGGFHVTAGITL